MMKNPTLKIRTYLPRGKHTHHYQKRTYLPSKKRTPLRTVIPTLLIKRGPAGFPRNSSVWSYSHLFSLGRIIPILKPAIPSPINITIIQAKSITNGFGASIWDEAKNFEAVRKSPLPTFPSTRSWIFRSLVGSNRDSVRVFRTFFQPIQANSW